MVGSVTLTPTDSGTRMTLTTQFRTLEELQKLVGMGMVEGITQAMSQIDDVLAG